MAREKTKPHAGSDFEDFLAEEGLLTESSELTVKRSLAWEVDRSRGARRIV